MTRNPDHAIVTPLSQRFHQLLTHPGGRNSRVIFFSTKCRRLDPCPRIRDIIDAHGFVGGILRDPPAGVDPFLFYRAYRNLS